MNDRTLSLGEQSLNYHSQPVPGKLKIVSSKSCKTQHDLALAYTPGVASACLEIEKDKTNVWKYTGRSNTISVVSDGTAVLGLGNIGPEAGMPVMEGKCVLFKTFADIDAIPLCFSHMHGKDGKTDPDKLITAVRALEPSFGGINLEDIGSPACFKVEKTLKSLMNIPVFHDDQHGTAIISLAGLLNALKIVGKDIRNCKFIISGAGAAGLACAEFYILAGARRENFILCDINGTIRSDRSDLFPEQRAFARDIKEKTLAEAIRGADVFMGVSAANILNQDMVRSMAKDPVVFAMANPEPEIMPELALAAGAAVVGTGRSDYPNQINNVLGFPGIFRGALDTRATDINETMKLAASYALSEIVCEKIPDSIHKRLTDAYPDDVKAGIFEGEIPLKRTLVIPKPFDPRVVPRVAKYVARAAMESGVAQVKIDNLDAYETEVSARIGKIW